MSMGRPFADFGTVGTQPLLGAQADVLPDPRMGSPSRHSSMDFDPMRSHSASNLQNYYASARFQPRHNEVDQMQQAKRRMAAQRERELRNYHQEQQYNRSESSSDASFVISRYKPLTDCGAGLFSQGGKSDRSVSPNAMSEEDRRELIARQHRALYGGPEGGSPSSPYFDGAPDGSTPRPSTGPTGTGVPGNSTGGARDPSPLAYNSFGVPEPPPGTAGSMAEEANATGHVSSNNASGSRSRADSNSSPTAAPNYSLFEGGNAPAGTSGHVNPATSATQQQTLRTSTSSPGDSPPRNATGKPGAPAPIGTRPVNPSLNKRGTPPAASPLSYGFAPNEAGSAGGNGAEGRTSSAASNSNAPGPARDTSGVKDGVSWGSGSGVWGKSNLGGVPASVWG